VSHDRAFLERTVADVLVLDGTGSAGRRPGGYAGWEQERRAVRSAGRAGSTGGRGGRPQRGDAGGGGGRANPTTVRARLRDAARTLERAQRTHDRLVAELEACGDDHVALAAVGARLGDAVADLGAAEDAWLEVAAVAEELGLAT